MAYRRSPLGEQQGRHRAVPELLAEKSGWGQPLPAGRERGIAIHGSFGSVVGAVAEVSMQGGLPRVHRVVAVMNLDTYQVIRSNQAPLVRRLPMVRGGLFTA